MRTWIVPTLGESSRAGESFCMPVWQLACHHTEQTAEAVCGSVLMDRGRCERKQGVRQPRATGLSSRRVPLLLAKMGKGAC